MSISKVLDVQQIIDDAPFSPAQRRSIGMVMAISVFIGFDALIMAISAPAIAEDWGTTTASLTSAIVASLLGMIVGGLFLAPRADRWGRRPVLIGGVLLFGVMTLAVVAVQNIDQMIPLRFIAGIGLGAVMPNTYAYGAEFAPKRRRATAVTVVGASSAGGGFVGGLLASAIIPTFGWRSVFVLGGILPLLLIPALLRWLPETVQFLTLSGKDDRARALLRSIDRDAVGTVDVPLVMQDHRRGEKPSMKLLFTRRLAPVTLVLCVVFFNAVLLILFLMSWIPSVLTDAGLSTGHAVAASAVCNLGAMFGGVGIGIMADRRRNPSRMLSICFTIAAVAIVATALSIGSIVVLMVSVFVVGAFAIGTQMCVNAVAAEIYPSWLRATGMGVLSGVDRVGSVVGPTIGGALLAAHVPAKTIFLLAVVPAIVASIGMAAVRWVAPRQVENLKSDSEDPTPELSGAGDHLRP